MFSTSSIIDNLNQSEGLEYKKLCRSLKITKKSDKDKLDIALNALEKLEIINKNADNEYSCSKDSDHIVAKICLLYTSPSPRDISGSRMPSSA